MAATRRPRQKTRPDKTGARYRNAKPRLLKAFPSLRGHKRIECDLEVQRARLKKIIDSSLDAIITVDETQRVVEFNKAAESMFLCSAVEVKGQPLDRFVPKRFRATNRGLIKAFAQAKKGSEKPGRLNLMVGLRTGGEEFPFESSISQVSVGKRKLITIVLRDVTERQLAERALREEEERFGTFLDHAPNLAFLKGTDGRYLYVNRRFEEVFQFGRGTVLGRKDVDVFPREQADQFQRNDRRVLESGQAEEFEETAWYGDGLHTSIVVKFPLRDTAGRIYAIGGIVTDITDRKRAEEALRENDLRMRAFLENSATIAWIKDAEGRHVYLSQNYERRFNVRLEDWLGKTDFEVWPQDIAERFREHDAIVLKENRRLEVVEQARDADGKVSWWLNSKFLFQDSCGRKYIGGLGVDITDRKQAEEELQLSQEELRRHRAQLQDLANKLFAAQETERQRIARELHDDFSQRLAALVLDIASLEQHASVLPERISKPLEPIREQLEQLADDVHNMAYQLHPSVLVHAGLHPAINDHVHKVAARTGLRILCKAKDVPSSLSIEQSTCLFRIVQECLQNIHKHANAHEVMIRLSGSSKGIGVSVTDNGKGFDVGGKNSQNKGLGLISMHERMRLMGGFLRVHSRPADGTKVCAWIPLKEGKA